MRKTIGVLAAAMLLGGCSALKNGYYQSVTVTTEPSSATCALAEEGGPEFSSVVSEGTFYNVRRGNDNLVLTCSKRGYLDTRVTIAPETDGEAVSLMVLNPLADVFTGTMHHYPAEVHLTLRRDS